MVAGFKTESELVQSFVRFLAITGLPKRVGMVREFDSGYGIADLALYRYKPHLSFSELTRFEQLPPRISVLLESKGASRRIFVNQFAELAGLAPKSAWRLLHQLVARGVLVSSGEQVFETVARIECPISEIVAIEAKLSDWRRALHQAFRYRTFATQSWVLLDEKHSRQAIRSLPVFQKLNIGLASICRAGHVYVHWEPESQAASSIAAYWSASVQLVRRL